MLCNSCVKNIKKGGACLGQCSTCSDHWNTPVTLQDSSEVCEVHSATKCAMYQSNYAGGFASACDGQIGWYNGEHPHCCGNCR